MPHVIDNWSAYDYKPGFMGLVKTSPTWITDEHRRRLEAYKLLASYLENSAREYLPNDQDPDSRREYGDPSLIVDTIVDSVLGDEPRIMVEGSRNRTEPDQFADKLQDWFDDWAKSSLVWQTVMVAEQDAVGLGDGVIELTWDSKGQTPRVTAYDPGFYFPVLDPAANHDKYPRKVHIAWEYEQWNSAKRMDERFLRRITYELVEFVEGTRNYPWNDEPSNVTCLKTDGTWRIEAVDSQGLFDLSESAATFEINQDGQLVQNLDIGIDFIPIIHIPNTIAHKEHYGRSSLQKVLQILDDLQSTDTDLLKTSRTTGSPPLGSKGGVKADENGVVTTYGPGQIIEGEITVVDTSKNLDALLKYNEMMVKRLSANVRLPEAVLGKLRPSEVPSGIALALSFGPLRSMIRRMRLVRDEKYPLLLKFIHRYLMLSDSSFINTDPPKISMAFGSFIPSDRATIISDILQLFEQKLIGRVTAIKMLIEDAGLDINDAADEVASVEKEDFDGAKVLSEALSSPEAAAEYLDREIPPPDPSRIALLEAEAKATAASRPPPAGGSDGNNPNGRNGQRPPQRSDA